MKRKALSILLALCMVLALPPGTARAAGTTVHAGTAQELKDALKSNTTIILEGKDYIYDYDLYIGGLENVTIRGTTGTRIMSTSEESLVLFVGNCKNLVLDNLVIGHDPAASEWGCSESVVMGQNTELTITNCDIFGCGFVGIVGMDSTITVEDSTIRDCSAYILTVSRGSMTFRNCIFSGNGYREPDQYALTSGWPGDVAFYGCTFTGNRNPQFADSDVHYTLDNCTFTDNSWSSPASTPSAPQVMLSPQNLSVNGKNNVWCEKYNIDGANYFKLRDLAWLLRGTTSEFAVGYDAATNTVTVTTGGDYMPNGAELASGIDNSSTAQPSSQTIVIDGTVRSDLTVYNIGGSNFFKLRELGAVLGFDVGYDAATNTATVNSR